MELLVGELVGNNQGETGVSKERTNGKNWWSNFHFLLSSWEMNDWSCLAQHKGANSRLMVFVEACRNYMLTCANEL